MTIERQAVVRNSDNIVINVSTVDTTRGWTAPAGTTAIASATAQIGDTYNPGDGSFTSPSLSPPALIKIPVNQQLLFVLRAADMQITTDQQFTKWFEGTTYSITDIRARRVSGGASVACLGGIYTAASKGGSALVAATQSWLGLSGSGKIARATLEALVETDAQTATPYLSLSTGSTAACGADIFIYGVILD